MAVPKSSDISKTGMQYLSCPSISWNHYEVLTFHRPVIKNDQRQLINLILGNPYLHPPLSTLTFGYNEPGFRTLAWKEQPLPGHLLHNKVSVPLAVFETWLVSRTRPACTLHQHSWQLPLTSLCCYYLGESLLEQHHWHSFQLWSWVTSCTMHYSSTEETDLYRWQATTSLAPFKQF